MNLIHRHKILRTSFVVIDGEPVQRVRDSVDFSVEYLDAGSSSPGETEVEKIIADFVRPFDLSRAPLFRVQLATGENKRILLVDIHHIVTDGVAQGILTKEFMALYGGNELPALRVQYNDFSEWQNNEKEKDVLKRQEEYWLNEFADEIPKLNLPLDYKRPPMQSFEGEHIKFELGVEETNALKALALEEGTTLFILMFTIFNVFLSKLSGQEDIIVGTPIAGRRHHDLQPLIGMFVNMLSTRNYPRGEKTFNDFLAEVNGRMLQAYENQDYQFEDLVEKVVVNREPSRNPLFDVVFVLQNLENESVEIPGLKLSPYKFESKISKFDLTVHGIEYEQTLRFSIEYCTKLFSRSTIERFLDYFKYLLSVIPVDTSKKLCRIDIMSEEEKRRILFDFNSTGWEYPRDKTLHELFETQAARLPHHTALVEVDGGRCLSYGELNAKANQLARKLKTLGVRPDQVVAVMVTPSLEMPVGLLGILKAGGAYLPIDPAYPVARAGFMLEDSGSEILIKTGPAGEHFEFVKEFVDLEDEDNYCGDQTNLPGETDPGHLAYVIYTSGTTGKPKGTLIENKNVVRLFFTDQPLFDFDHFDIWTLFHSYCFDFSVWEMYGALLYGGKLVIIHGMTARDPRRFLGVLEKERVTVLSQTPSAFYNLMDEALIHPPGELFIRYVVFGGEALKPAKLKEWNAAYPRTKLINMYGITETTVHVTYKEIGAEEITSGVSNIGRPIPTLNTYIMDRHFKLQPIGVFGELCVGGEGVGRGYLNRPELTGEKFTLNPYKPGELLYRSGDLVRLTPGGDMEYAGRIDHQVKIRGYRIELGEIENRLLDHEEIKEAVVMANGNGDEQENDNYLIAYYVRGNGEPPAVSRLREFLGKRLPDYMIPSYFVELDAMPLTSNGKVDRKALPAPETGSADRLEYVAPRNEVEEALVEIWSDVLNTGAEHIGIESNFFEIGGHSLKATVLKSNIHRKFNVDIPLVEIFTTPTISGLADYIQSSEESLYSAIEPAAEKEYYDLSYAQQRLWILSQFEEDSTAYNMPYAFVISGEFDIEAFSKAVRAAAHRHESLRTVFKIVDGVPRQKIIRDFKFYLEQTDLRNYEETEIETRARCIYTEYANKPFDLEHGPLFGFKLVRLEDRKFLFLSNIHHIITDGWSQRILGREMLLLYNSFSIGKENPLEPLELQYKDYSAWHNSLVGKGRFSMAGRYWLEKFKDKPVGIELPLDHSRSVIQTFNGGRVPFTINKETVSKLKRFCIEENATLFMGLLALLSTFLYRYTGQDDIIIGSPVAGRKKQELHSLMGFLVNTLVYRIDLESSETFARILQKVKLEALDCYEYQDYPFDLLIDRLGLDRDLSRSPLFNVMLAHNNTEVRAHDPAGNVGELTASTYTHKDDFNMSKFDLIYFINEINDEINVKIEYNSDLFERGTIERMAKNFTILLDDVLMNGNRKSLHQLECIAEIEYEKIVKTFNDNTRQFSGLSIQEFFEEQARKSGDRAAVVCNDDVITYRCLNERANRWAHYLREEYSLKPNDIVGISIDRSIEMIAVILGVVKSGAGYVAIDPNYPEDRVIHMLEDSNAGLVIVDDKNPRLFDNYAGETININTGWDRVRVKSPENPAPRNNPSDIIYIIYTSGSTGTPNGAMLSHGILANLTCWQREVSTIDTSLRCLQFTSINFCVSFQEIMITLASGGEVHLIGDVERQDVDYLMDFLTAHDIGLLYLPFSYLNFLFNESNRWGEKTYKNSLMHIITAGEQLKVTPGLKRFLDRNSHIQLHNHYGASETHVVTTYTLDASTASRVPIPPAGKPVSNTGIYIVDEDNRVVPIGVWGELMVECVVEVSGYINNSRLTDQKLLEKCELTGGKKRLYRTGDLGRWLEDGNIELKGRKDSQVKIRGFRIEPGEIESKILALRDIEDCVVVVKEAGAEDAGQGPGGQKYLVAYVVTGTLTETEVTRNIGKHLPQYMVPRIVILDCLPLMPNGKVDRANLPEPEFDMNETYSAPMDEVQETLVKMWSEVLNIDRGRVGIDDNFFELGGHSLKATVLMARIHKELNVKIELIAIFQTPTIRELSECIKGAAGDIWTSLEPVEKKEYYGLSSPQKRLYVLYQLDGRSVGYNMPIPLEMEGNLDVDSFKRAFRQLVDRHESLRTSFEMIDEEPVQRIHNSVTLKIEYPETRDSQTGEAVTDVNTIRRFVRPFDLSLAPLLRIGLIKTGEDRHILLLDMHHIITDGLSLGILVNDFVSLYMEEELPPLTIQYKDFSEWRNRALQSLDIKKQEEFWLTEFPPGDEIPVLDLAADFPRPSIQAFDGDRIKFELEVKETAALNRMALDKKVTPFIVLLAIYNVLLSRLSGQEDIVVGTPVAGRGHSDLGAIVGMFVNTLALRNRPDGTKTFEAFLEEVKAKTLKAFENQDFQFEDLVGQVVVKRDMSHNPIFDTMFALQNTDMSGIEIPGLKIKPCANKSGTSNFDMILMAVESGDRYHLSWRYGTALFKPQTVERFIGYFRRIVSSVTDDPGRKLSSIEILSEGERKRIVIDFNRAEAEYDDGKTINRVFEEHVLKGSGNSAVLFNGIDLTYNELNERANRLARVIRANGVRTDSIVAVMMEKSIEMVVGILGVLKAGAAYLPLDPTYPPDRLNFMMQDSGVSLLVSKTQLKTTVSFNVPNSIFLDSDREIIARESPGNLPPLSNPRNLAYIIYTSGSTGVPKGVLIEHRSVINLKTWQSLAFGIDSNSRVIQAFSYSFDGAVGETFMALLNGATLVMLNLKDAGPEKLVEYINNFRINLGVFVPSMIRQVNPDDLERPDELTVVSVGEACTADLVRRWSKKCTFVNGYGPTETTVYSHIWIPEIDDIGKHNLIPIGKPISNYKSYILDSYLNPVPVGVSGEIYISGVGMARGYFNRTQITVERFIPNPFFLKGKFVEKGNRFFKSARHDLEEFRNEHERSICKRNDLEIRAIGKVPSDEVLKLVESLNCDLLKNTQSYIETYCDEPIMYDGFCRYLYEGMGNSYSSCGLNLEVLTDLLSTEDFDGLKGIDFGFGNAEIMQTLSDAGAVMRGFDLSPFFVYRARLKGADVKMLKVDSEPETFERESGIAGGTYDFAISTLVLDRAENPGFLIENLFNCIKPGGKFAVQTLLPIIPYDDGDVDNPIVYTHPENRITPGKEVHEDKLFLLSLLYRLGARDLCVSRLPFSVSSNDGVQDYKVWSFSGIKRDARPEENIYLKMYKTGDLGRYLPDGNIVFLGRVDHQVKIRGFRIELGEIENQLLNHPAIEEALVLEKSDKKGDKYLCAYLVPDREIPRGELREYLSGSLPPYMVPSHFVILEKMPLTPNGKVNRSALPEPEVTKTGRDFAAPGDEIQETLVKIWSDVLDLETDVIGIDDNFFDLGGHSLKATILVSKIHREFDVKVPLTEIFKTPTTRELAALIKNTVREKFIPLEKIEKREYYSLSSSQKRMYVVQQLKAESINYNMPTTVVLEGDIDREKLEGIFKKLVERHESFRTSFEFVQNEAVQKIHDNVLFQIEYSEHSEAEAPRIVTNFVRPFDLGTPPLLRVGLVKIEAEKHIFMVDMHHIIADAVSMEVLKREFMALYHGVPLAPLTLQYKDFSQWQVKHMDSGELKKQEQYWLSRFVSNVPVLNLPLDFSRPSVRDIDKGDSISFGFDGGLSKKLYDLCKETGTTLSMLLLAVYTVLLSRFSKQEDIVVGTILTGRTHADLENIIGLFLNILPVRNLPAAGMTFREFLEQVGTNALESYENQDYPYDELVVKLGAHAGSGRNALFDAVFNMNNMAQGKIENALLKLKPYKNEMRFAKFDLYLQAAESGGKIAMMLRYSTELFRNSTAERITTCYTEIVEQVVENIEIKLDDILFSHDFETVTSFSIQKESEGDFEFEF